MTLVAVWALGLSPITYTKLAAITGCSERTIYRTVRHLIDRGYVKIMEHGAGPETASVFCVIESKIRSSAKLSLM